MCDSWVIYLLWLSRQWLAFQSSCQAESISFGALLLLQNLGLRCLRISKVHHLVQQFIDNNEVVADTLLLQNLEVFGENLHKLVEEKEDFSGICVSLGQCENVKVAVANIKVLYDIPTHVRIFAVVVRTQKE